MADDDIPEGEDLQQEGSEFPIEESEDLEEEFEADESVEALAESEAADDDEDDVESPDRPKKDERAEEEDDDDDEEEDVEADLGEILKDRIAAGDEEDEEEDAAAPPKPASDLAPKRADEWTCEQCFFIVSSSQFGSKADARCPQGEEPCSSIDRAFQ